uniref:Calcitonin receptor-like receptor n=1 Tax=Anabas testudineus TaxID=64144 RepID=A0A7N6BAF5_ANATE
MARRKINSIGRSWTVALILLFNLTKIFVRASLEVNETQTTSVYHELGLTRNTIVTAQFECYQKIMKDNTESRPEPMCNRTWDGWLCWDDTRPGVISEQHCPDYFQDFDPSEIVTKICTDDGQWFHMLVAISCFSFRRSLSCQRITLHKNLFFSYVLNSVITIILLTAVANNQELLQRNPTSCKVSQFIHLYLFGCNYFWMLCEGIYLHTLIVVAVFAEKQHLMWYYLLGWGFPLLPASIHAIARSYYYNDNCWISSKTSLLYIIHGPICAALVVNLFFLLNIVRVLITKLKVTHQAESSLYLKAVRATLILVPLLGIQYVLLPYKPSGRASSEIYDYIMHILMHYQGLLVATIFCFFNGEVSWDMPFINFYFLHAHIHKAIHTSTV